MPAAESMIRTVPGAKFEPVGGVIEGSAPLSTGDSALPVPPPPTPVTRATTTVTTSARTAIPTNSGVRLRPAGAASRSSAGGSAGGGGDRAGEDRTTTPGPAGVATSDQPTPFHQRTIPGAPSGSGYHPGCAGPVIAPA